MKKTNISCLALLSLSLTACSPMPKECAETWEKMESFAKSMGISDEQQVPCPKCNAANQPGAKFCHSCGAQMVVPQAACPKCNAANPAGAKFCHSCGANLQASSCTKCNAQLAPGAKFCPECGAQQG